MQGKFKIELLYFTPEPEMMPVLTKFIGLMDIYFYEFEL